MTMPIMRVGRRSVLLGGLLAAVGAFSIAALNALVFRFPIPFSGYGSGHGAVLPSLLAVLFCGFVGGYPLLAVLGAVSGLIASFIGKHDGKRTIYLTLAFALLADLLATLTLAVLDVFIGPW